MNHTKRYDIPIMNFIWVKISFSAGIYLLKVNNRNTTTSCKICSKLTIKIPERRQCQLGYHCKDILFINCKIIQPVISSGNVLVFFTTVHFPAKGALKISALFLKSDIELPTTRAGGIFRIFFDIKIGLGQTNMFLDFFDIKIGLGQTNMFLEQFQNHLTLHASQQYFVSLLQ